MLLEYCCKISGTYNNLIMARGIDLECLVYHFFTRHHKIKYWKNWYIIVIHPDRPGSISIGTICSTNQFFQYLSSK